MESNNKKSERDSQSVNSQSNMEYYQELMIVLEDIENNMIELEKILRI